MSFETPVAEVVLFAEEIFVSGEAEVTGGIVLPEIPLE